MRKLSIVKLSHIHGVFACFINGFEERNFV